MKKIIPYLFFIVSVLIMVLVSSCGTKKKLTDREKETAVTSIKKDIAITGQKDIVTNTNIKRELNSITYTPVDPAKPMQTTDKEGNVTSTTNTIIKKEFVKDSIHQTKTDNSRTDITDNSKLSVKSIKKNALLIPKVQGFLYGPGFLVHWPWSWPLVYG